MTSNEKKVEHHESKGGEHQQVADAQITNSKDSAIKHRQELIDASKAYRFSHAGNKFSIQMEDGKDVQDGRALQVSIDNHGHIVAKETDAQGGTHQTEAAIGKDGQLHQIRSEDVDQYGNKTIDKYDPKTGRTKEEIKEDLLSKTDTKYDHDGQAKSQDTYNKLTGEKSHIDYRLNPENAPPIPWPEIPQVPPTIPLPEVPQNPPSIPWPEVPQLPPDGKSQFIDGKAPVHDLPSDRAGAQNERGMESIVRPHPADKQFDEKDGLWHDKKNNQVVEPPPPKDYAIGALYNADNMKYVAWSLEHGKGAAQNERSMESIVRPHPADKQFDEKDGLWHDKKNNQVVEPPPPKDYAIGALYDADNMKYVAWALDHGKGAGQNERGLESLVRPHPADKQFDEKDGMWHDKKNNQVVEPPPPKDYAIGALYDADNMKYVAWSLEHGRGAVQNERGMESFLRPDPPDRRFDEKDKLWHDKRSGEVVPPPRTEAYGAMGALYTADNQNYEAYQITHGHEKPHQNERGVEGMMRPHPADRHFDEKEGLWHNNKSNKVVEPPATESYGAMAALHTADQLKYVAYLLDQGKSQNQSERHLSGEHQPVHHQAERFTRQHAENGELKPEVDHTKPGAVIGRWGEVSDDFYNRVNTAYDSLPESDKEILSKAGVSIVTRRVVNGETGTPAEYDPADNRVYVGMEGEGTSGAVKLHSENDDPAGSMKHEVGHAMYRALHAENWTGFQDSLAREQKLLTAKADTGDKQSRIDKERLSHLLSSPSELFAEMYAMMRGRHSDRVDLVKKYFPDAYEQMVKNFPH